MIIWWAIISFMVGLYVMFGIWAVLNTPLGLLIIAPVILVFSIWLSITISFNKRFKFKEAVK